VIGANWSVDEEQEWSGYGYSTIIASDGRVLAQAKTRTGSEIIYAELPVSTSSGSGSG
jgi:predicted amidohydrolase